MQVISTENVWVQKLKKNQKKHIFLFVFFFFLLVAIRFLFYLIFFFSLPMPIADLFHVLNQNRENCPNFPFQQQKWCNINDSSLILFLNFQKNTNFPFSAVLLNLILADDYFSFYGDIFFMFLRNE